MQAQNYFLVVEQYQRLVTRGNGEAGICNLRNVVVDTKMNLKSTKHHSLNAATQGVLNGARRGLKGST